MYMMIRAYDDCTCMTERSDNIVSLLEAAAIYLRDESCFSVKIWEELPENDTRIILNYYRR